MESGISRLEGIRENDLFQILAYYLAVKIIRNQMNHAADQGVDDDTQEAIEYLRSKGINPEKKVEEIKLLLNKGIDATKVAERHISRKQVTT